MTSRIFGENWWRDLDLINALKKGENVVIPTDTLYGIVGRAELPEAVERIFDLKKRNHSKPVIVLISDLEELKKFNVRLDSAEKLFLEKIWPGQVSVALPAPDNQWSFLHRETKNIAFRVPAPDKLRKFLKLAGPLVAPSANPENLPPAETPEEAQAYFGEEIFGYVASGRLSGQPSTLIALEAGQIQLIREGAVPFSRLQEIIKNLQV